jgi:glycosyltransferase involved in cell wall biosynthesis
MSAGDGAGSSFVSCLMVTRNRAAIARRAVECFAAQTWTSKELVIIDDGDEDYAPMLAPFLEQGHHIRYVSARGPRLRLGALRNVAIDHARGPWCIQWDDDEWYHPERITTQMNAANGATTVALRWTLVSVASPTRGELSFRADAGVATPGTVLHRRNAARYPDLARGEDSEFLLALRRSGGLQVLGREASHLFIRCFHGANTWDEQHFLRRLHRRPVDWPSYAAARWLHGDLRRHRAFDLDARERASIDALAGADSASSASSSGGAR